MEDALVPRIKFLLQPSTTRLNPCCNGRCTRTSLNIKTIINHDSVLILVVMEDALVLINEIASKTGVTVLILVVMEDALVPPLIFTMGI